MALTMKSINKVFQNKIVLYILLGLSFFNLLGYLARNNLSAIIVFLLTGYFSTFFTKNMSYILLAPLVITNFVVALFTMQKIKFKEGMKDKNSDDKHKNSDDKHDNDDDHEKEDSDDEDNKVKGASLTKKSKNSESSKPKKIENLEDNDENEDDEDDDNFVSAKIKKHENMENAYNNLEKMMGPKNMSKMSNGIKGIANDQKELYKIVEKMEPLFDKVSGMLDKFSNSPLATMLPKISNNDNN